MAKLRQSRTRVNKAGTCVYRRVHTETRIPTAKVFWSGNHQAIQLPKEFCLATDEVEIFRRGDEIVLREMPRTLARGFELLCELPDFNRDDTSPQERDRR
jgi:antitoxin VapB